MGMVERSSYIMMAIYVFLYPIFLMTGMHASAVTQTEGMIDKFVDHDTGSIEGSDIQANIPTELSTDSAIIGTETLSVVSVIRMVWDFLKWVLAALVGGMFALMLMLEFPIVICIFIGLPFTLIQILGMISAVRGWDL